MPLQTKMLCPFHGCTLAKGTSATPGGVWFFTAVVVNNSECRRLRSYDDETYWTENCLHRGFEPGNKGMQRCLFSGTISVSLTGSSIFVGTVVVAAFDWINYGGWYNFMATVPSWKNILSVKWWARNEETPWEKLAWTSHSSEAKPMYAGQEGSSNLSETH